MKHVTFVILNGVGCCYVLAIEQRMFYNHRDSVLPHVGGHGFLRFAGQSTITNLDPNIEFIEQEVQNLERDFSRWYSRHCDCPSEGVK